MARQSYRNSQLTHNRPVALPGYSGTCPTLEIFSYDSMRYESLRSVNTAGLTHLAFAVEDVAAVLDKSKQEGGGQVGELVKTQYPNNVTAIFVYAKDIEGNIIELQSWDKHENQ